MRFCSISNFDRSLSMLLAKPKNGYTSLKSDIKKGFSELSFENLLGLRDVIIYREEFLLIKVRVQNGGQNLSKRDGFRVYIMLHKIEKNCTFLEVYPKRGKCARVNLDEKTIEKLIEKYVHCCKEECLINYEF